MTPKEKAAFVVDESKCVGCGRCVDVCAGMVLHLDEAGHPRMDDFERFGWRGCWGCEHCLAVCPAGALSIFGKTPEDSLPPAPALRHLPGSAPYPGDRQEVRKPI